MPGRAWLAAEAGLAVGMGAWLLPLVSYPNPICLPGNLPACLAALQAFKEGDVRFLICTDVAARGIDIQVGGLEPLLEPLLELLQGLLPGSSPHQAVAAAAAALLPPLTPACLGTACPLPPSSLPACLQGLPYVINMTLPDRSEDYIHR